MLDEKQFKKLKTIEIPQYIYQIQVSKSRNVKYFHQESGRGKVKKALQDIPKKYKATSYDLLGFALNDKNEKIIANPLAAGTAKYVPINSQVLYSSSGQFIRAKVMKELHAYYSEIFEVLVPFTKQEYPLFIWIDWYAPNQHKTQDIDNFTYITEKAMFDSLQECGIIPDDTVDYICGQGSLFHEIENFEDRKLEISFYTYIDSLQTKLQII
jgi:Holliday junction resolvase RusA-like endonuclease